MAARRISKSIKLVTIAVLGSIAIWALYSLLVRRGYIFPLALWNEVICERCPLEFTYHQPPLGAELIFSRQPLAKLLIQPFDRSSISILVEKSQYRLTIYQNKRAVKSYPIVLGQKPKGDKFSEGDLRTPEGILYLKDIYPHPEWSKFLWLDYPNAASWRKHLAEKQAGRLPWYKPIGHSVGIHGVPKNSDKLIDNQVNWTWGCVSLKNADVDEIYQVVRVGTLVEIVP